MYELVILASAVSWWVSALVYKTGPANIFEWLREYINAKLKTNSPFHCTLCISPYVLVILLVIQLFFPLFITFFGVLGLALALRGTSQEF